MMNRIIGLTGGISSGKSTVARILEEKGFYRIDADRITRDIYAPGGVGSAVIKKEFGEKYILKDDRVNKALLRELVFSDSKKLNKLNKLIHPLIKDSIVKELNKTDGNVVIEAALLFEVKLDELCDILWLIVIDPIIQRERLKIRDNIDDEMIEKILNSQNRYTVAIDKFDRIIYNNGNMDDLKASVEVALNE